MTFSIAFKKSLPKAADTIVILVTDSKKLPPMGKLIDNSAKNLLARALKSNKNFTGKSGQILTTFLPEKSDHDYTRAVLFGIGKAGELDQTDAENIGGKLYAALNKSGAENIIIVDETDKQTKKINNAGLCAAIASGIKLRSYHFDRYKTEKDEAPKAKIKSISIVSETSTESKKLFSQYSDINEGVFLARDLVNEAPNVLYPDSYAKLIKKELAPLGVKIEILDEKKLEKLGMGGILAVGQGSERKPRMVIMHWNGDKKSKDKAPIALVGKGVTFDTGGISLKPGAGMDEMKMDMGGSASVVGAMKAIALSQQKTNVVGIVGLAENMPSHNAYRPGDIITSYAGKTVEVLNTDAEGRLVLIDALTYVQEKYKPETVINLATLTGAIMVALGHEYCGTFVNNDALWKKLETAGRATGEKLWRMPLDEVWKKDMVSDVADLRNLGKTGRWGGACTAAGFLEHFIEKDTKWAHMDIAGTAWIKSDKPTVPKFGTGFGVRTLEKLIRDYYSA